MELHQNYQDKAQSANAGGGGRRCRQRKESRTSGFMIRPAGRRQRNFEVTQKRPIIEQTEHSLMPCIHLSICAKRCRGFYPPTFQMTSPKGFDRETKSRPRVDKKSFRFPRKVVSKCVEGRAAKLFCFKVNATPVDINRFGASECVISRLIATDLLFF